ncbi:hypothetical protein [Cohnella yongneupensis]|uniref:Glycosyltransferase RgtA/B/C/D-like domain-containing protein n=1 Tax=Cohnella yongneupensis TaxID=425006 RepID=A0ABW0R399_9BACL
MRTNKLPFLFGALVVMAMLSMVPNNSYNDPDTFWHIELGRYMLQHHMVLHHAIHTYAGSALPYIPHEFGFQIVIALLYNAFGWPGIFILTSSSLYFLIWGLYRLAAVSRKELRYDEPPALVVAIVIAVAICVYYYYFTSRPQMISSGLIVWFFVFLREYRMSGKVKTVALLILLSVLIANVHAGVWPVVAVFTGMAALEEIAEKRLTKKRLAAFVAVSVSGLFNVGGWRSILYILTVTQHHFNLLINEWKPIQFTSFDNLPRLIALLFFAAILPYSIHKKLFRTFVMLGVLYLGVSNYKQNLFLWLFIPYFAATAVEAVPKLRVMQFRIGQRSFLACAASGLILLTAYASIHPTTINAVKYPVEEMTYVLQQTPAGDRPKVMAHYGSSGYVMYRGGDVLTDGRQDPFITDASRGALGWTAFERSMYGFSDRLPDIVRADKPDYLLARSTESRTLLDDWAKRYGAPVFKGKYGSVFRISPSQ